MEGRQTISIQIIKYKMSGGKNKVTLREIGLLSGGGYCFIEGSCHLQGNVGAQTYKK